MLELAEKELNIHNDLVHPLNYSVLFIRGKH